MAGVLTLAQIATRAYVVDGQPGSGVNPPLKSDFLNVFALIDALLSDLALFSAIGVAYPTLALLTADTTGAHPLGLVFNDPTPANNGIYLWTAGSPGSWSDTLITIPSSVAAAITALQAAAPWYNATWAQVTQVKLALQAAGAFAAVRIAVVADPTQPVNEWWTTGGFVTVGGTLGAFIKTTLGYSTGQMATLWAAAALIVY